MKLLYYSLVAVAILSILLPTVKSEDSEESDGGQVSIDVVDINPENIEEVDTGEDEAGESNENGELPFADEGEVDPDVDTNGDSVVQGNALLAPLASIVGGASTTGIQDKQVEATDCWNQYVATTASTFTALDQSTDNLKTVTDDMRTNAKQSCNTPDTCMAIVTKTADALTTAAGNYESAASTLRNLQGCNSVITEFLPLTNV